MKTKMKPARLRSFLLALVMVVGMLSMPQVAYAKGTTIDTVYLTYDTSKVILNTAYTEGEVNLMLRKSISSATDGVTVDKSNSGLSYLNGKAISGIGYGTNQMTEGRTYLVCYFLKAAAGYDWADKFDTTSIRFYLNGTATKPKQILYNASGNGYYVYFTLGTPSSAPVVKSVTIDQSDVSVQTGSSFSFTASVAGTATDKTVAWSVTGQTSAATAITSEGILTVGKDEAAETITVKAVSNADPAKYREVNVAIDKIVFIDKVSLTYDASKVILNTAYSEEEIQTVIRQSISSATKGVTVDGTYLCYRYGIGYKNVGYGDLLSESKTYFVQYSLKVAAGYDWTDKSNKTSIQFYRNGAEVTPATIRYTGDNNIYTIYIELGTPSTAPIVKSVTIDQSDVSIQAGSSFSFTASVAGNAADKTVAWSVSGAGSSDTKISAEGVLSVGGNETAKTITVTATSKADAGKSASLAVSVSEAPAGKLITNFVTRMYQQCLSREPDEAGLAGWVEQLESGQMDGAQIAEAFVFSNEMLNKNLSHEEFVKVLYRAMMGREADEEGLNGWTKELTNDYSTRSEVTKAFVESAEFTAICESYGIIRGDYVAVGDIERFVAGFYTKCLGRPADAAGHWGWVKQLQQKNLNGAQIAEAFFFSEEFVNKNVSDEVYIATLYRTILGREADAEGLAGWVGQLQSSQMTRREILGAFIESDEFTKLCAGYGIERGSL